MADQTKRKRTFTADRLTFWIIAASLPVAFATWIIRYFAPAAPVAVWNGWRFLALSRGQWHNVLGASATLTAIVYMVRLGCNPRMWRNAEARKRRDWRKWRYEWGTFAAGVTVVSLTLLRGCAGLGDRIDAYWANVYAAPPCRYAKDMTLRRLAKRLDIEPDQAADALRREGFPVNDLDRSIAEIARMRYAPPVAVYNTVRAISPPVNTPGGSPRTPQTSPAP